MAGAAAGRHCPLLMERSENVLQPLLERRVAKAEADSAQADVREHRAGHKFVGQKRTNHKRGRRRGHAPQAQGTVREARERFGERVRPDRMAVHQEIAAAGFTVLGEMHQRAGTVVDVNGRHPRAGRAELQHPAPGHDRVDHALAKPRRVAIDPSGKRSDDRQPGDDVAVEALERGRDAASPGGGAAWFVLGDGTHAGRAVAARVRDVHDASRRACRHCVQQVRIHHHAIAGDRFGAPPRHAPPAQRVRRKVEHPVGSGFVLPLTGLEQIAHDGDRAGAAHSLRRLQRTREADHRMAAGHQRRDQLRADEPARSCDKRGRLRVACHPDSVAARARRRPPTALAQDSYGARTEPGSKMKGP